MHVLELDGGLVDAACAAVVAALQHFRRPDAAIEGGNEVRIFTTEERVPVPLSLLHHPYCVTIGLFGGGEGLLVDAMARESRVCEGEVVVTANRQGEICQIAKLGGVPADALLLLRCAELGVEKAKQLSAAVSEAVVKDAEQRNLGGLIAELSAENER